MLCGQPARVSQTPSWDRTHPAFLQCRPASPSDCQAEFGEQLSFAEAGDAQCPGVKILRYPFSLQGQLEESRAQSTTNMRTPFAPIKACESKPAAHGPDVFDVDAKRRQRPDPLCRKVVRIPPVLGIL